MRFCSTSTRLINKSGLERKRERMRELLNSIRTPNGIRFKKKAILRDLKINTACAYRWWGRRGELAKQILNLPSLTCSFVCMLFFMFWRGWSVRLLQFDRERGKRANWQTSWLYLRLTFCKSIFMAGQLPTSNRNIMSSLFSFLAVEWLDFVSLVRLIIIAGQAVLMDIRCLWRQKSHEFK